MSLCGFSCFLTISTKLTKTTTKDISCIFFPFSLVCIVSTQYCFSCFLFFLKFFSPPCLSFQFTLDSYNNHSCNQSIQPGIFVASCFSFLVCPSPFYSPIKAKTHTAEADLPVSWELSTSSACIMALANTLASSLLPKFRPQTCRASRHWWKVSVAWLYFSPLGMAQFITTWRCPS